MGVEQLHAGPEPVELGQVDRPVLVDPVVDDRLALGGRGDHCEERQVVDVQPGKGIGWILSMGERSSTAVRSDRPAGCGR